MLNTKVRVGAFVAAIFVVGCASGQVSEVANILNGDKCWAILIKQERVVVCRENFFSINMGGSLDGKYIEVTGYVRKVEEGYYIYPSMDMYVYSGGKGGIYLELNEGQGRGLRDELSGYEGPITVVGVFYNQGRGLISGAIGRIRVVDSMFWRQEFPGEKPLLPSK